MLVIRCYDMAHFHLKLCLNCIIIGIIDDPLKSLFSYENTNSFQSFYEPKFTPSFAATFTDPVLEQEARTICKGDAMCLFDIAATGRTEIGKDTLEQQVLIQQTSILFSSPSKLFINFSA